MVLSEDEEGGQGFGGHVEEEGREGGREGSVVVEGGGGGGGGGGSDVFPLPTKVVNKTHKLT